MLRSFKYVIRVNIFGIIHKKEYIKMSFLDTYNTKCVHPDDDQLKRSKHAAPLKTNLVVSTVIT